MSAEKEAVREGRQRLLDLRDLMKQAAFRRIAWWVLYRLAGTDSDPDRGEHTHETAKLIGRAQVGRELGRQLRRASIDLWLKMESEHPPAHLIHSDGESLGP